MLRFSANLGFLWPDRPLLQRIEAAAKAGFEAVELHSPYDVDPIAVRDTCVKCDVRLLGINTPVDPARGENGLGAVPGREADFAQLFQRSLTFARLAGASAIHVMAGLVPPDERAAGAKTFANNLRAVAGPAHDAGLTLLIEPLNERSNPGYFYSRVEAAATILHDVAAANVKLMFDVFHVGVAQGDVLTRLRQHFAMIGHVQIAAVPTRAEPDEGEIAFPAIFNELEALGYDGWIGAEYKPRGDTDAGLAWRQKLGVQGSSRPAS